MSILEDYLQVDENVSVHLNENIYLYNLNQIYIIVVLNDETQTYSSVAHKQHDMLYMRVYHCDAVLSAQWRSELMNIHQFYASLYIVFKCIPVIY